MRTRAISLAGALVIAAVVVSSGRSAPPLLTVTTDDGRSYTGEVDEATDQEQLVLRSGSSRAWVGRTIPWAMIRGGTINGEPIVATELLAAAEQIASAPPAAERPRFTTPKSESATPSLLIPAAAPRITSVSFDAVLANWDDDVEADGLIVYLQPIDAWGFYAPATGSVEIELFAPERRTFQHAPLHGGTSHGLIARWTCAVTADDFGPRGAALKFPFAAPHPEFDERLGAYGLVHVRFSVPGSGAFEASQDGVRIRPYAPIRDRMQLNTGHRFFPTERTGRGKSAFTRAAGG